MAFSAERLLQIFDSLTADKRTGRQPERRSEPRVGLRTQVSISVVQGNRQIKQKQVWLRDVSVSGLGFTLEEAMEISSFLMAHFPSRRQPIAALYQVMRCEELGANSYLIGCKLVRYVTGGPKPKAGDVPVKAGTPEAAVQTVS